MKNAPIGYECPFCEISESLPNPARSDAVVLVDENVFALVPTLYYGNTKGNCLIIPKKHYENLFDIPDQLGQEIFRATRKIAGAMQTAFECEGFSTRQHNGPAGNQDVWHYHLHIFPRSFNDGFYGGQPQPYSPTERIELANQLSAALALRSNLGEA